MPAFTKKLAEHLCEHMGLVHDDDLEGLGVTVSQRRRMVADGVLVKVLDAVYRAASTPLTFEMRCRAICMSDPRAVITGRAAGRIWGLRKMGSSSTIEVRIPHHQHTLAGDANIVLRRCPTVPDMDITVRNDGIRVVSPPRLIFDLGASLDDEVLESVVEQVLDRGWCTIPTILDVGRPLIHRARPGSARFVRVLGSRPAWLKPADSDHEVRLRRALERKGVRGLVRQHELRLPSGWTIHADLAIPGIQWAIPVDHVTWHSGRVDARRDKQNDRLAHAIGWQVDRVTDDDIDHHLRRTVNELVATWKRRTDQFERGAA